MKMVEGASKPHGESMNREQALRSYRDNVYRYQNYGVRDIEFIRDHANRTIMDFFGYDVDTKYVHEALAERSNAPRPMSHFLIIILNDSI